MHLLRFGKPAGPVRQARLHPLMQAHYDPSLPFWVATDHAVFGTFSDVLSAARLADAIVPTQPEGERIIVTVEGSTVVLALAGTGPRRYPDAR